MDADTRTARLLEARRLSAAKKRRDTLKVIDAIVTRGGRITFAGVAREAAVSGWFVRNQPDIRTAIECAIRDQQVAGFPDKRTLGFSTAGLRSDILLAREEIRELRRERDHLRDRLRQRLGAELDHAPRSELVERITELERRTQELAAEHTEAATLASRFEAELAAAASDLAAARAANRRLMREANAPRASG